MSKQTEIEGIKNVIQNNEKLRFFMRISILKRGKPVYYKQTPFETDISVTCADKISADNLIYFLEKLRNDASNNPRITGFDYVIPE